MQTSNNSEHATRAEQSALVDAASSVWNGLNEHINIKIAVGEKIVEAMRPYYDCELEQAFITDSDIRHIKRGHGKGEESRGQKSISPEDFGCIPEVLNHFDSLERTKTDKLGNKLFLLQKDIEGRTYLVAAQRGKRKLQIKSMWKENQSGASC